mmetsp:Transcript_52606/g.94446  ORF Transcript_52606/g.94446 Transcript_52606/m.94446 type:complete len:212 (-) Transcript_52606:68-703(-)|eukprot:CAMPEP_0197624952 /NCGR_PEP_ID=MMETSP1338-20131121/4441_1 /TAXON_ID=43686 ORGANISM="Pelagodinium beii, Strain RCC1491" /NCGR_SAMPLE_ID=MMETSP1338 /ASSEMBLY_ACC=CAM_ASM_000754 /LENGTH=211 /DNA_ID=CAMNT_0043195219 /DNA_START=48 /DNA_END=683 /DNA_ORIENTATION=+
MANQTLKGSLGEDDPKMAARIAGRQQAEAEGKRMVAAMSQKAGGSLPKSSGDLRTESTSHMLGTLQMTLRELDLEVKAEEQGAEELRRHLQRLKNEHAELRKARDRAAALVGGFEAGGASFEKEYARLMDNSDDTYKMVRAKHKDAIGILKKDEHFGYHPAYKRHTDQFEAAYFTPMPLKKKEEKKSPAELKLERMKKSGALSTALGSGSS